LYHVFVHSLAQRLFGQIRQEELLRAGERVGVAVSGGIDSVALLRLLLELRGELGLVISVVHFNHKLRGAESEADEQFVSALARDHDVEFFCDGDDVAGHAREEGVSVETAARELRYGFFRHLVGEGRDGAPQGLKPGSFGGANSPAETVPFHKLDKVATGHTLDDQAETVLMRMIRGAGLRGIGGIYPRLAVENEDGEFCGEIVRLLLGIRRRDLEQYLRDIGQTWREDSTNDDAKFTRNRVRKLLVPLLEKEFNPAVAENLAELAEIARAEEDYWENEIAGWMGTGVHWSEPEWARQPATRLVQIGLPDSNQAPQELRSKIDSARWLVMNASVDRLWFLGEPLAVQRRVIKAIGERAGLPLEFKHVEEILRFAAAEGASGKELSLPLGWKMLREPIELIFVTPDLRQPAPPQDYEYDLPVPSEVSISEAGSLIEVKRVAPGGEAYNPEHLLDADSLPGRLKVRNWRAGDRFWPAHTKSPKKVKELLQERHVAQPERKLWPVVLSGDEIVWMRGFPLPARYQAKPGHEGVLIRERTASALPGGIRTS
jgi:tRNA(Ile)-lysidine synthase